MAANTVFKGKDYLGEVCGSYRVLGYARKHRCPSGQTQDYWKVECVHCGAIKEIGKQHVLNAHQEGCSSCKKVRFAGTKSALWKGDGEHVTGMYFGKTKHSAEKRKLEFSVTREDMEEQFKKQNGKCAYTGMELHFGDKTVRPTASIDRIDSAVGYTKENIQWVHKDVNHMKMDMNHAQFIGICRTITENTSK